MDEKKLKALAAELAKGLLNRSRPHCIFPHADEVNRRNGAQCRAD